MLFDNSALIPIIGITASYMERLKQTNGETWQIQQMAEPA